MSANNKAKSTLALMSQGYELQEALTVEEKEARLRMMTEAYLEAGFITQDDVNAQGVFIDQFEAYCCPYIVHNEKREMVASVRLIFGEFDRLPIAHLELALEGGNAPKGLACEISQLIIRKDHRISSNPHLNHSLMLILVLQAAIAAMQRGVKTLCAVVNEELYQRLDRLGFSMVLVGSPQTLTVSPYRDPTELYPIVESVTITKRIVEDLMRVSKESG